MPFAPFSSSLPYHQKQAAITKIVPTAITRLTWLIESHRRCIFCCTFLKVTLTGYYPASCPLVLGLSSVAVQQRSSNLLTFIIYTIFHDLSSIIYTIFFMFSASQKVSNRNNKMSAPLFSNPFNLLITVLLQPLKKGAAALPFWLLLF